MLMPPATTAPVTSVNTIALSVIAWLMASTIRVGAGSEPAPRSMNIFSNTGSTLVIITKTTSTPTAMITSG